MRKQHSVLRRWLLFALGAPVTMGVAIGAATITGACAGDPVPLHREEIAFVSDDPNFEAAETKSISTALPAEEKIGTNCSVAQPTIVAEHEDRSAGAWEPVLAYSGGFIGVVWEHLTIEGSESMFAVVDPAGDMVVAPMSLTPDHTLSAGERPRIAGIEGGFAVVWVDGSRDDKKIQLVTLDYQGNRLLETTVGDSTDVAHPSVARQAYVPRNNPAMLSELAVLWRDGATSQSLTATGVTGHHRLKFEILDRDGASKHGERAIQLPSGDPLIYAGRLVLGGEDYAMSWRSRPNGWALHGQMSLAILDRYGVPRWSPQTFGKVRWSWTQTPSLVWSGSEYGIVQLVEVDGGQEVTLSRVNDYGTIVERNKVAARNNACNAAIAYNGEHYAALWENDCNGAGGELHLVLVDGSGRALRADGSPCASNTAESPCGVHRISTGTEDETTQYPDLISAEGKFFVSWGDRVNKRIYFSAVTCQP